MDPTMKMLSPYAVVTWTGNESETDLACSQAGEASVTGRLMGAVVSQSPEAWTLKPLSYGLMVQL